MFLATIPAVLWVDQVGRKPVLISGAFLMGATLPRQLDQIWPLSVRGKGLSIAASSNWMNNFIVGEVTPTMLDKLGFGTFVFFGVFSLLGGLFVMFFVPETKGLTLEEMDEVFGNSGGLALDDQQRQAAIYRRLGLIVDSQEDDISEKQEDVRKSTGEA
ncbi:hypothetical protein C0993_003770 [Termitomyces sp. T159_Od127]|nr:hypothetical protein C0993_003770 [Termitomyces sp. T159_Od127]